MKRTGCRDSHEVSSDFFLSAGYQRLDKAPLSSTRPHVLDWAEVDAAAAAAWLLQQLYPKWSVSADRHLCSRNRSVNFVDDPLRNLYTYRLTKLCSHFL